jgi:hypothetical protein
MTVDLIVVASILLGATARTLCTTTAQDKEEPAKASA